MVKILFFDENYFACLFPSITYCFIFDMLKTNIGGDINGYEYLVGIWLGLIRSSRT